ncbi:hypothetical protein [Streptomyces sp. NRRL S-15]|uniref:hypothetical protein n=1 Tax=Streptomyces sp. NRRL S-15 TaxID=1463886 RepID=UPI000AD874B4|nr:hypothetical protein [Streptomyces sp. NRRL S-15]
MADPELRAQVAELMEAGRGDVLAAMVLAKFTPQERELIAEKLLKREASGPSK